MKKQKCEKGITLIALIVTIIVLLILAVVAIRSVQDGGIIGKAQEATTKYTEAQVKEEVQLVLNDGYVANNNYGTPLKDYLPEKFGEANVRETNEGFEITYKGYVTTVGNDYKIANIGKKTYDEINWLWQTNADGKTATITGIDITGMEGTKSIYSTYIFKLYLENNTLHIPSTLKDENGNIKTVTDFCFDDATTADGSYISYAGIKKIIMPDTLKTWSTNKTHYHGVFVDLETIDFGSGLTTIGEKAFYFSQNLKSVTIPEGVTSIGDCAFQYCTDLVEITIPEGVTSIGSFAFDWCYNLKEITIPSSVTSIGNNAFKNCSALTGIIIPERVTSIEYGAFIECSSLTEITIPSTVTNIGNNAFYMCSNLTDIYYGGSTFPYTEALPAGCTVHTNSPGPLN